MVKGKPLNIVDIKIRTLNFIGRTKFTSSSPGFAAYVKAASAYLTGKTLVQAALYNQYIGYYELLMICLAVKVLVLHMAGRCILVVDIFKRLTLEAYFKQNLYFLPKTIFYTDEIF